MAPSSNLIFYDDQCVLCTSLSIFIIKRDKAATFSFVSLGSDHAENIPEIEPSDSTTSSLAYISNNQVYYRSDAALRILYKLGGFWKITIIFRIFPRFINDFVYYLISRNRYIIFSRPEYCKNKVC